MIVSTIHMPDQTRHTGSIEILPTLGSKMLIEGKEYDVAELVFNPVTGHVDIFVAEEQLVASVFTTEDGTWIAVLDDLAFTPCVGESVRFEGGSIASPRFVEVPLKVIAIEAVYGGSPNAPHCTVFYTVEQVEEN